MRTATNSTHCEVMHTGGGVDMSKKVGSSAAAAHESEIPVLQTPRGHREKRGKDVARTAKESTERNGYNAHREYAVRKTGTARKANTRRSSAGGRRS